MAVTENKAKPQKQKAQFGKYLRETKAEMKKVSWPSWKELRQHTGVVMTSIVIIGAYLWIIDSAMSRVIKVVLGN